MNDLDADHRIAMAGATCSSQHCDRYLGLRSSIRIRTSAGDALFCPACAEKLVEKLQIALKKVVIR